MMFFITSVAITVAGLIQHFAVRRWSGWIWGALAFPVAVLLGWATGLMVYGAAVELGGIQFDGRFFVRATGQSFWLALVGAIGGAFFGRKSRKKQPNANESATIEDPIQHIGDLEKAAAAPVVLADVSPQSRQDSNILESFGKEQPSRTQEMQGHQLQLSDGPQTAFVDRKGYYMNQRIISAIIVALGLVIGGFLAGGRFEMVQSNTNAVTRLDRYTGDVVMCVPGSRGGGCGFILETPPSQR